MLHLSLTVVDTTDGDGVLVTVRRSNVRFVKDGVARALTGCLREGAKSYAKDADENYLAVSQACQAAKEGLRLAEVGKFISITDLRLNTCSAGDEVASLRFR